MNEESLRVPARDLADPSHARRSLRASIDRRVQRARRRRAASGGRRVVVAAGCVLALGAGGAVAHETTTSGKSARSSSTMSSAAGYDVTAVQRKLGITADGVAGPQTRRAIRRFQKRNGLTVDGVVGPQTLAALGLSSRKATETETETSPSTESSGSAPSAELARIAQCESGGNLRAVSPDGQYRGKYQFSRETWETVGGSGDPIDASEAEQDKRAAILMERQGPSAWPVCSKQ